MNDVYIEMIKQAPMGAAMIIIVYLFLSTENKREQQRIENAKSIEQERKQHDLNIMNMWAGNFRQLVEQVNLGQREIAKVLSEHEKASKERYEKMGITGDLLDAAKEQLRK